ncbi:MAG: FAD:protein FMN transferase [Oscillospiraceae bacterium]
MLVDAKILTTGGFFIKKFPFIAFVFLGIVSTMLVFSSCTANRFVTDISPEFTSETFLMDTVVTQKVYGKNGEKVIGMALKILKDIEKDYSSYLPKSVVSEINAASGISPVTVSPEMFRVIRRCALFSEKSGGIFDLTISPLIKLWNITGDHPSIPSPEEILTAQKRMDYRLVSFNEKEHTVFLTKPDMALDFGATVKGYAAQKVLHLYQESDLTGALLSLGGNIAVFGTKSDGSPFSIGLRDPLGDAGDYFATLSATETVIATSGAYERFFEQDGKIYHHILDPKTGYPAESDLLSVSVISPDGLLADYLSTVLFMMGTDAVKDHLDDERFSLVAVDQNHRVYVSPNVKKQFQLTSSSYTLAP